MRGPGALALLIGAILISACQNSPPDTTERARMSRAMDKMEAEQAQSDIARAAADASAANDAGETKALGIAQEKQNRENIK